MGLRLYTKEKIILSYANALEINGTLLLPQFSHMARTEEERTSLKHADKQAKDIYTELGFERIVRVRAGDLGISAGGIHCLTKQYPLPK